MTILIAAFGILVAAAGAYAALWPERLLRAVIPLTITSRLRWLAGGMRIAVGAGLVAGAPATDYPLVVQAFGMVLAAVGVAVLAAGNRRIQSLLDWVRSQGPGLVRAGGLGAVVFGAFLLVAAG